MEQNLRKYSIEQLQVFKGCIIKRWWNASFDKTTRLHFPAGWYSALVTEVIKVDSFESPLLHCSYDDGDQEDKTFTEVFCSEQTRIVSLPQEAVPVLVDLRQPGISQNSPNRRKLSRPFKDKASMPFGVAFNASVTDEDSSDSGVSGTDDASDVAASDELRKSRKRPAPRSATAGQGKRQKAASGRSRLAIGSGTNGSAGQREEPEVHDASAKSTDTVHSCVSDDDSRESDSQWHPLSDAAVAASDRDVDSAPSSAPTLGRLPPRKSTAPGNQEASQQLWADMRYRETTDPDPDNGIGSAGQIACVQLLDFMCHRNLEFPLGPHVNFVSGTNGSGKSAVLNAIQLCLGARAADTGRNTKASDFIRTVPSGEDRPTSAVATVFIWNTGMDAYHPHTFGNKIGIVKRISANTTTTRLEDQDGRLVVQGKQHLEKLLDHLGVEAKNKAICMSQDTCRIFAAEVDGRQKFELYNHATQLLKTREDHVRSQGNIEATRDCARAAKDELKTKRKTLDSVREKLAALQEVAPLQELYNAVHNCMAWAHISEMRDQLVNQRQIAEVRLPALFEEAVEQESEISRNLMAIQEQCDPKVEQLAALEPKVAKLAKENAEAQADMRQAGKDKRKVDMDSRRRSEAAEVAEQDAAAYAEELHVQEADHDHLSETARRRFDDDVKSARAATMAASVDKETSTQQLNEADTAKKQADEVAERTTATEADLARRVEQHCSTITKLQSCQGNPLLAFGSSGIVRLMKCIEQDVKGGAFNRPPLGPLGTLLALTNEKWGVAIESNCGRHLNSFLVHNMADLKRLKEICRSVTTPMPTVVVTSFDHPPHDLASKPQPPPDVLTMLKVLRVQQGPLQHVVSNFLIDMKLERAALVDGNSQATLDFMRGPHSCLVAAAWNPAGDKAHCRGRSTTMNHNNRRVVPRLTQDVSGLLASERAALRVAEAAKGTAAAACNEAKAHKRAMDSAWSSAMKARNAATVALADSQAAYDTLVRKGPDLDGIGAAGDAQRLAAQKSAHAAVLQREADEYATKLLEVIAKEQRMRTLVEDLKAQSQELVDISEAIKKELADLAVARDEQLAAQDQWVQQKEKLEQKCSEMAMDVAKRQKALNVNIPVASEICSELEGDRCREAVAKYLCGEGPVDLHPNTDPTTLDKAVEMVCSPKELQIQRDSIKARIDKCQARFKSNLDDLKVQREFLEELVGRRGRELQVVAGNLESAHAGVINRRQRYHQICKSADSQLSNHFNLMCGRRNLGGSVAIDRERHTLELVVIVDSSQQDRDCRPKLAFAPAAKSATKGLSGGERSIVTLCFALALQTVVKAPFFCMDEYDVYMDRINRTLGLRLLLEAAMDNQERQLILLSPQDTDTVTKAMDLCRSSNYNDMPRDFVKVIRMKPARENATER